MADHIIEKDLDEKINLVLKAELETRRKLRTERLKGRVIILPGWKDKRSVIDFIKLLFEEMGKWDDWDEPRIFTDGEYDGNQTPYEYLTIHLKLVVRASSRAESNLLLLFLRQIIDAHKGKVDWEYISERLEWHLFDVDYEGDDYANGDADDNAEISNVEIQRTNLDASELVNRIESIEHSYSAIFAPGEDVKTELMGIETLDSDVIPVDGWNEKKGCHVSYQKALSFGTVYATETYRMGSDTIVWTREAIRCSLLSMLMSGIGTNGFYRAG